MKIKVNSVNEPSWKELNVKSNLPESLKKLEEIAQNLWWVWNSDAKNMFRTIDREAWIEAHSNPIQLLNILSYEKLIALGNDAAFVKKLDGIYDNFKAYMETPLRPLSHIPY
jgi:starch phosphorylase